MSSSNKVKGERRGDKDGPGYHIPLFEMHFLSPQILLGLTGGESVQTTRDIRIHLANSMELVANYFPHSGLLLLHLTSDIVRKNS